MRAFWLLAFVGLALASARGEQSVTLAWDPNPESDIGGYIVYYGCASRNYTNAVNVGNVTTNTVRGLVDGATYFFAVTAYNTNGLESDFSDEVSYSSASRKPSRTRNARQQAWYLEGSEILLAFCSLPVELGPRGPECDPGLGPQPRPGSHRGHRLLGQREPQLSLPHQRRAVLHRDHPRLAGRPDLLLCRHRDQQRRPGERLFQRGQYLHS